MEITQRKISIIIADDHPLFVKGLASVLQEEFLVLGSASNGKELLQLVEADQPDLVIVDLNMPVLDGLNTCRQIGKQFPLVKSVVVSFCYDVQIEHQLKLAGVKGYFTKDIDAEILIDGIKLIVSGGEYYQETRERRLIHSDGIFPNYEAFIDHYKLSARELKIISLIRSGMTSNEISAELFISVNTVESHRKNIFKKLDIKNIQGLVEFAIKHAL